MTAACTECGYTSTLRGLSLHSCDIAAQGGRCEDYPCCGHTDGDGCQTLPEHTSAYYLDNPARTHLGCDHNTGHCDYEDEDDYEDVSESAYQAAVMDAFHYGTELPDPEDYR